jgi:hypothetical protein
MFSFAIVRSSSDQGRLDSIIASSLKAGRLAASACRASYWASLTFGASIMRRFVLPNLVELSILATLAVLAATIVAAFGQPQVAIVVAGFPVVLAAMLMGARRTGQLDAAPAPVVAPAPEAEQSA